MNITNNKSKKNSTEKIEKALIELIQNRELSEIKVTDLVKKAKINRSTFYVNYLDIYDLADKIKTKMYQNILDLYQDETIKKEHSYNYLKLFRHIKENQIYYRTMFKLNFDFSIHYNNYLEKENAIKYLGTTKHLEYHVEFFKAGMSAIIKKWLFNGCIESPEDMVEILNKEYIRKSLEK